MLTIDWSQYDNLGPRARYDAIGGLIDETKAAVAAKRAEIAADLVDRTGAQQAADTLGISATRIYQLAARHRATTAAQTTEYAIWDDTIPGGRTFRDTLTTALGDTVDDFDLDAIDKDYRAAINTALDHLGITLAGEVFYGPYPRTTDAAEIAAIVESVDLWDIAARHDTNPPTA